MEKCQNLSGKLWKSHGILIRILEKEEEKERHAYRDEQKERQKETELNRRIDRERMRAKGGEVEERRD